MAWSLLATLNASRKKPIGTGFSQKRQKMLSLGSKEPKTGYEKRSKKAKVGRYKESEDSELKLDSI